MLVKPSGPTRDARVEIGARHAPFGQWWPRRFGARRRRRFEQATSEPTSSVCRQAGQRLRLGQQRQRCARRAAGQRGDAQRAAFDGALRRRQRTSVLSTSALARASTACRSRARAGLDDALRLALVGEATPPPPGAAAARAAPGTASPARRRPGAFAPPARPLSPACTLRRRRLAGAARAAEEIELPVEGAGDVQVSCRRKPSSFAAPAPAPSERLGRCWHRASPASARSSRRRAWASRTSAFAFTASAISTSSTGSAKAAQKGAAGSPSGSGHHERRFGWVCGALWSGGAGCRTRRQRGQRDQGTFTHGRLRASTSACSYGGGASLHSVRRRTPA